MFEVAYGTEGPGRKGARGTDGPGRKDVGGNSSGGGGLDTWRAHVSGCFGDTLAGAVLLDGVELLGGVASAVVVVVVVVDVVHVVVVDVRALQGLVALEVALSAPKDTGLGIGVHLHVLANAVGIELVVTWSVGVGLV